MAPRYTEEQAREAVAQSRSYSEALRRLGMCCTGGGHSILRKWAGIWGISTDHFDSAAASLEGLRRSAAAGRTPLEELLVAGRFTNRGRLNARLYEAGIKDRRCEICGQTEEWNGRRMSLVLDHVNGVADDNRLENLRIVCANCNATLDTHCGRNAALARDRHCERCGERFRPKRRDQRFCSRACGSRWDRLGRPHPGARRVNRPPYEQLLAEIAEMGYAGAGRKYGVSDNAIRKWRRAYEVERARSAEAGSDTA